MTNPILKKLIYAFCRNFQRLPKLDNGNFSCIENLLCSANRALSNIATLVLGICENCSRLRFSQLHTKIYTHQSYLFGFKLQHHGGGH